MESLRLKPEALVGSILFLLAFSSKTFFQADLSLPVTVAAGYIGKLNNEPKNRSDRYIFLLWLDKLTMIISWRNPSKHPTKIFIDGFYMLIVPKNGKTIFFAYV